MRDSESGAAIGVIGSNQTTNEENYLLQKFARTALRTNNIDHERTADYAAFARALAGHNGKAASLRETATAPAILLIGGNPTEEHPLLAWNLRTNVRLNRARLYIANTKAIKLERMAKAAQQLVRRRLPNILPRSLEKQRGVPQGRAGRGIAARDLRPRVSRRQIAELVAWGLKRGNVRFAFLGGYANSRGAADMGLLPDLLPGYVPVTAPGAFAEYAACPQHLARLCRRCLMPPPKANWAHCWSLAPIRSQSSAWITELEEDLCHCRGYFSDRDRGTSRCGVSCRQSLRKVRHCDQHLRRCAIGAEGSRPRRSEVRV